MGDHGGGNHRDHVAPSRRCGECTCGRTWVDDCRLCRARRTATNYRNHSGRQQSWLAFTALLTSPADLSDPRARSSHRAAQPTKKVTQAEGAHARASGAAVVVSLLLSLSLNGSLILGRSRSFKAVSAEGGTQNLNGSELPGTGTSRVGKRVGFTPSRVRISYPPPVPHRARCRRAPPRGGALRRCPSGRTRSAARRPRTLGGVWSVTSPSPTKGAQEFRRPAGRRWRPRRRTSCPSRAADRDSSRRGRAGKKLDSMPAPSDRRRRWTSASNQSVPPARPEASPLDTGHRGEKAHPCAEGDAANGDGAAFPVVVAESA